MTLSIPRAWIWSSRDQGCSSAAPLQQISLRSCPRSLKRVDGLAVFWGCILRNHGDRELKIGFNGSLLSRTESRCTVEEPFLCSRIFCCTRHEVIFEAIENDICCGWID